MKQPYEKMRRSGMEWLGDIPAHWSIGRLKNSAKCWVSNVDKVPSERELAVKLCNYTNVYYNESIRPDIGLMETTATADEIQRFGLRVNDVLITKDSEEWNDIAVPALVVETAPDLVCGYHLAIIRPDYKKLLGRFLLRVFQSCAINQQFQIVATGVTRYGLPKSSIGDAWIPIPSYSEQAIIAEFLDRKTADIDALVSKKRALIEKLKEKRSALISCTVTRGLPPEAARVAGLEPNPKMRSSGIGWLGDVPEHWSVKQLKWAIRFQRGHDLPGEERIDGNVPLVSSSGKSATHSVAIAKGPGIVTGRYGTIGEFYLIELDYWPLNTTLYSIHLRGNYPPFLQYMLMNLSPLFLLNAVKSAVPGVDRNDIHPVFTVVPPVPEQRAIADFLDRETAKIDSLIAKIEQAIERLQEYRIALITAAVTGKIDVRQEQSGLGGQSGHSGHGDKVSSGPARKGVHA